MPPGESWVDAEGTQPPYLRGGEGAPGPVLGRTLPGLRRDKAGSWVALLGPSCPLSPRPLHASGLFLPGVLPVCPSLPARQAGGWSTLLCARGASAAASRAESTCLSALLCISFLMWLLLLSSFVHSE